MRSSTPAATLPIVTSKRSSHDAILALAAKNPFACPTRIFRFYRSAAAFFVAFCALFCSVSASAATLTVNTLADSVDAVNSCSTGGTCSLRDAIVQSGTIAPNVTINFGPGILGTILLSSSQGPLTIGSLSSQTLSISGPGANLLTVSGGKSTQVLRIASGSVAISGLTIANGSSGTNPGGGIQVGASANITLQACAIVGNSTAVSVGYGGGGIYNAGTLSIVDSTLSGNSSPGFGGAIDNAASLTIVNSTIYGNSATEQGGGIYDAGTSFSISDTTISGNSVEGSGGGLYEQYMAIRTQFAISGSILAGNTGGDCAGNAGSQYPTDDCPSTGNGNLIGGTPNLGPLTWNGGATQTMIPLPGSPAIGGGGTATITADQRGFARATSGTVDIGAVQTHYLQVTTLNDQTDAPSACATGTGSTCSLRDAIVLANSSAYATGADIYIPESGTISLDIALPAIAGFMNLIGPGANLLTINAANEYNSIGDSNIFTIAGSGRATISGLTLTGGSAGGYFGGAIYNSANGNLTVNACNITGNTTEAYGGGIATASPSLTNVFGSTISNNSSTANSGGGIENQGTMSLTDSTVAGNTASYTSAGYGGAIYNGGTLVINSSTIAANSASHVGGIYDAAGTITAYNSIIAGNTSAGTANSGDCGQCGTLDASNLVTTPPQLSPLQVNGAGTSIPTMIPLPGSPAIGAGSVGLSGGLTADERGFQRVNGTTAMDKGAVQTNYTAIHFMQQPMNSVVSQPISPAPTVEVIETNTISDTTDEINGIPITLGFSGGSSEIAGTLTEKTASNVATFSGLSVNTVGTGYTLFVASPLLNGTLVNSGSFNVVNPVAAMPTFSPAPRTYTSAQTVVISDTTPGAAIYYTTNGTTPTTASTLYSGPITVSATETIEAIAVATGYTNSAVATAAYTVNLPVAATPTFSPAAGTYTSAQTVVISDTTPGAAIYYTTNGTAPWTAGAILYSGPIAVSSSETIQAEAVATGYTNSAVASAAYTINLTAAAPTFSLAAGTYTSAQTLTIADTTPGAAIYYTVNGTAPTAASTLYSGPITVSATETVEAIAVAPNYSNSPVATAAYTINLAAFTLSAAPASVSVTQGASGTSAVAVIGQNGFSGSVTLAAAGLPSGVTATFSPNPASTASVLTLTATAAAAVTASPVTVAVTGTSGNLTATANVALTVTAASPVCNPTSPITPYVALNGAWNTTPESSFTVPSGTAVDLGPWPTSGGTWSWTGPSGFTSTLREIDNIALATGANTYTATYTVSGCTYTQTFTVTVGPVNPIVPYIEVSGAWIVPSSSTATVPSTTTAVNLGPWPVSGGSWTWTGPNGFTASTREIDNIALATGANVYTATYTVNGTSYTQTFTITVGTGTNPIVPYIEVNGVWIVPSSSTATVSSATTAVNLGPWPVSGGSWAWTGPNGFTSTSREIDNIALSAGVNTYTATYTVNGTSYTQAFVITVGGCATANPIVPYIEVNGAWNQTPESAVAVASGTSVSLGPWPASGGSWSWTGPNGYTSASREIDGIALSGGSNVYTATYTDPTGCAYTEPFTITVN